MRVSLIIPVRNGEAYLPALMESCLAQDFDDFEIIVVDDGSTDGTGKLADSRSRENPRVRVLHLPRCGVAAARQSGAEAATGEYLCFADADDLMAPGALRAMAAADADIICGDYREIDSSGEALAQSGSTGISGSGTEFLDWLWSHRKGYLWGKLIRRRLFLECRKLPEPLVFCEDLLMLVQIASAAQSVIHCGTTVYFYRRHGGSLCATRVSAGEWARRYQGIAVDAAFLWETGMESEQARNICGEMVLFYTGLFLCHRGGFSAGDGELKRLAGRLFRHRAVREGMMRRSRRMFRGSYFAYRFPLPVHCVYLLMLKFVWKRI